MFKKRGVGRYTGESLLTRLLTTGFKKVRRKEIVVIILSFSIRTDFGSWIMMFMETVQLYGRPFVSKLWHDVRAVFSHVYLQSFLLHDIRAFFCHVYLRSFLLCGIFIRKYNYDHFLTNVHIYGHKKSPYTAFSRRIVEEKVHAPIPKGIVGSFEFAVLHRNLKDWHERPLKCVCEF